MNHLWANVADAKWWPLEIRDSGLVAQLKIRRLCVARWRRRQREQGHYKIFFSCAKCSGILFTSFVQVTTYAKPAKNWGLLNQINKLPVLSNLIYQKTITFNKLCSDKKKSLHNAFEFTNFSITSAGIN